MAIQIYCECGNAIPVGPELSGRKVRCKGCGVVMSVPEIPAEPESGPADYEVVGDDAPAMFCPSCGASVAPADTACLACGADLGREGAAGLLDRIPRPLLVGVLVLGLFGLLGGVARYFWKASRPAAYAQQGMSALQAEDLARAERCFQDTLALEPDHPVALLGMVRVGIKKPEPRLVERHADRAIKACQDDSERARIRIAYAQVLLDGGKYLEAYNQAVSAREDDSAVEGVDAIKGLSKLQAGKKDEARDFLRAAVTARSNDFRVYRELARLLREQGDLAEARVNMETAVAQRPEDVELWLELATLREKTGDAQGNRDALETAVRRAPDNALAHARLSKVYLQGNDLDRALAEAQKARDLAPDDVEAQVAIGRILLVQGKPEEARAELERALRLGTNWEAEFLLGQALIRTRQVAAGLKKLQEALAARPEPALYLEAAGLALEAREGAAAAALLVAALEKDERNYDARVLLARALLSQENGRQRHDKDIEAHLRRAIEADPARLEAPLMLADHLGEHRFDHDGAMAILTRALPGQAVDTLDRLRQLFLDEKTGEAEVVIARLRDQLAPGHRDVLFARGVACIRAKRWGDAIASLEALKRIDPGYADLDRRLRRAHEGKLYNE